MPPKPELRENPKRCVYITGTIDQALVDRLTPQITQLRFESSDPITAYIDSLGGSTVHARLLMDLLKAPTQDGDTCKVVTVATGLAASAAADLLVFGNYALAYPHARVWFHGTRRTPGAPVTTELAASIAESLRRTNESFAVELATSTLSRFFFRYVYLKSDFEQIRKDLSKPDYSDAECMAHAIARKIVGGANLPVEALAKHGRTAEITDYLIQKSTNDKRTFKRRAQFEAQLLRWLIDFKLKEKAKDELWTFSNGGMSDLQHDFDMFLDYHTGKHMRNLKDQVLSWGPFCLDDQEQQAYGQLPTPDKDKWLIAQKEQTVKALWQLLVSICRSLQEGEHVLGAEDAFWLGLIDEVSGKQLPNIRMVIEAGAPPVSVPPPIPATTVSNSSTPAQEAVDSGLAPPESNTAPPPS
jgi:ATP-dependent protease ClpP protease subunit